MTVVNAAGMLPADSVLAMADLTRRVREAARSLEEFFTRYPHIPALDAHAFAATVVDRVGSFPLGVSAPGEVWYDPGQSVVIGTYWAAGSEPLALYSQSVMMPVRVPVRLAVG